MSTASRQRQARAAPSPVIQSIVSQFAEEASFLWLLRDAAVRAPPYTLRDLARLDERIDAHLDGLLVAGGAGWQVCVDELSWSEPGEVFAAAAIAFSSDDVARMQPVLDVARKSPELARAMIAALGFLPHKQVMSRIEQLTGSHSPEMQFLGLSASAIQRIDPGRPLTDSLENDDPRLRARARRATSELGRHDLLPPLRAGLKDDDSLARFWAACSLGLLGDRGVADQLRGFAEDPEFPRQATALDLALRVLDVPQANTWRQELASDPATLRLAIAAAGIVGDAVAVPWLLEQMSDAKLARIAGDSFTSITGADLTLLKLDVPAPEDAGAGPTDNPEDQSVAMDPDENLPWPDPVKIETWWSTNAKRFPPGKRHLLGQPLVRESLLNTLREGRQCHRAAAAVELMLANPKGKSSLFEVRAHARTQKQNLAGLR